MFSIIMEEQHMAFKYSQRWIWEHKLTFWGMRQDNMLCWSITRHTLFRGWFRVIVSVTVKLGGTIASRLKWSWARGSQRAQVPRRWWLWDAVCIAIAIRTVGTHVGRFRLSLRPRARLIVWLTVLHRGSMPAPSCEAAARAPNHVFTIGYVYCELY